MLISHIPGKQINIKKKNCWKMVFYGMFSSVLPGNLLTTDSLKISTRQTTSIPESTIQTTSLQISTMLESVLSTRQPDDPTTLPGKGAFRIYEWGGGEKLTFGSTKNADQILVPPKSPAGF